MRKVATRLTLVESGETNKDVEPTPAAHSRDSAKSGLTYFRLLPRVVSFIHLVSSPFHHGALSDWLGSG